MRRKQKTARCQNCAEQRALTFNFTMAFQPIVDCKEHRVFGYEALVRGLRNEPANEIIAQVNDDNRYLFDQSCRVKAITLAAQLKLPGMLSINFMPRAIYQPERCIKSTLAAAAEKGFPTNRLMFEFSEAEQVEDSAFLQSIIGFYTGQGFTMAIDDFGAGYSGLGLLTRFITPIVKIDMALIRDIDRDKNRQMILKNTLNLFQDLHIAPLAEGIETVAEKNWLQHAGVNLMQGYLFAKPGFESLPKVELD